MWTVELVNAADKATGTKSRCSREGLQLRASAPATLADLEAGAMVRGYETVIEQEVGFVVL